MAEAQTAVVLKKSRVGKRAVLIPKGVYHGVHNPTTDRLVVQQISSPKPWDARFGGPRPSDVARPPDSDDADRDVSGAAADPTESETK